MKDSVVDILKRHFDGDLLKKCHSCHKNKTTLSKCSKCKVASYCSVGCQQSHYGFHKSACEFIGGREKRKAEVKKEKKWVSRRRVEDAPNPMLQLVRQLRDHPVWLETLASSPPEQVAHWARTSRDFNIYIVRNQQFWYYFVRYHFPDSLEENQPFLSYIDYRLIAQRFLGGLGIPYTRAMEANARDRSIYDTFFIMSQNEAALRTYIRGTALKEIYRLLMTSKMFRFLFRNNQLFWYWVIQLKLIGDDPLFDYADVKENTPFNPSNDYAARAKEILQNLDPLRVSYNSDEVDLFRNAPVAPDIREEDDGHRFTIPFWRVLFNGINETLEEVEYDSTAISISTIQIDGVDIIPIWHDHDLILTLTHNEGFVASEFVESGVTIDQEDLMPGDSIEFSLDTGPWESRILHFRWNATFLRPFGVPNPDFEVWDNTGHRQISINAPVYSAEVRFRVFMPLIWFDTNVGQNIHSEHLEVLVENDIVPYQTFLDNHVNLISDTRNFEIRLVPEGDIRPYLVKK